MGACLDLIAVWWAQEEGGRAAAAPGVRACLMGPGAWGLRLGLLGLWARPGADSSLHGRAAV